MKREVIGLAMLSLVSCGGGSGAAGTGGSGGHAGNGSGGGTATGGTGGATDGGASCPAFTPCGGNLVGTWKVIQTCASSRYDLSGACGGADAWATSVFTLTGTITYNGDLTYASSLSGTQVVHYHYPSSCLAPSSCDQFQQTLANGGVTNLTCTTDAAAATCDCDGVAPATVKSQTGTYSVTGTTVTDAGDDGTTSSGPYCVEGNILRTGGFASDAGATTPGGVVLERQ
jgi:hypothetical protein